MTVDASSAAIRHVEAAVELLKRPTAAQVAKCAESLQQAVSLATGWRDGHFGPEAGEPRVLRTSLQRASQLLESAAGLYAGWGRAAGVLCETYAPTGETGALPGGARLSVRG